MQINPILAIDGYKTSHREQYPAGTSRVYSNFTPRGNRYFHSPLADDALCFSACRVFYTGLWSICLMTNFLLSRKSR